MSPHPAARASAEAGRGGHAGLPPACPRLRVHPLAAMAVALLAAGCATAPQAPPPAIPPAGAISAASPAPAPLPAAPGSDELDAYDDSWLEEEAETARVSAIPDPLEPVNRGVFGANRWVDRLVFEPIARAYARAVPAPARAAVARLFDNLNQPVVMVNELLQLHPLHAAETTGRFVVNTTAGVAGLFDVATPLGLERHEADFGETLAHAGLGPGFYLVLPLVGPSSARDALGQLVDVALRPDTWLLSPGGRLVLAASGGVVEREAHLRDLEELERASLDFYVAIRELYATAREQRIREGD